MFRCCNNYQQAAWLGHLDCMWSLRDRRLHPWTEASCTLAAEGGHLECLKYLRKLGCPWSEKTSAAAAAAGHLKCLVYAWSHGCPYSAETMEKLHGTKEWKAALRIADAWYNAYWNPRFRVCKQRLDKNFQELTKTK